MHVTDGGRVAGGGRGDGGGIGEIPGRAGNDERRVGRNERRVGRDKGRVGREEAGGILGGNRRRGRRKGGKSRLDEGINGREIGAQAAGSGGQGIERPDRHQRIETGQAGQRVGGRLLLLLQPFGRQFPDFPQLLDALLLMDFRILLALLAQGVVGDVFQPFLGFFQLGFRNIAARHGVHIEGVRAGKERIDHMLFVLAEIDDGRVAGQQAARGQRICGGRVLDMVAQEDALVGRIEHLGIVEQVGRRTLFNHLTQVQEDGVIRNPAGLVKGMGDHYNRIVFFQLDEQVFDGLAGKGVEGAGGFVGQDVFGFHGQGPGQAETLLLSQGQADGRASEPVFHLVPQAHFGEVFFNHIRQFLLPVHSVDPAAVSHVVEDGHGQGTGFLGHQADVPAELQQFLVVGTDDIVRAQEDTAAHLQSFHVVMHTVQRFQQGALSAAGRPDDAGNAVAREGEVHLPEDGIPSNGDTQVSDR